MLTTNHVIIITIIIIISSIIIIIIIIIIIMIIIITIIYIMINQLLPLLVGSVDTAKTPIWDDRCGAAGSGDLKMDVRFSGGQMSKHLPSRLPISDLVGGG